MIKKLSIVTLQLNIPRDMFYGDLEVVIPEPKNIERSAGGIQSLTEAANLLAAAKRPVIVSGAFGTINFATFYNF